MWFGLLKSRNSNWTKLVSVAITKNPKVFFFKEGSLKPKHNYKAAVCLVSVLCFAKKLQVCFVK